MIEVFDDIEQGTETWRLARLGLPTASVFHTVMAKGKDGGASVTRRSLLYSLAGEIMTGQPAEGYENADMIRGREMESEARAYYAFMTNEHVKQVGFIRNGSKGCSPDSLIGESGMLEIKTKKPSVLIEALLRSDPPPEHRAQLQGALWVAEREWIDFIAYWPRMPECLHRVHRDEAHIRDIAAAVDRFNDELAALVVRLRGDTEHLKDALKKSVLLAG